MSELNLGLKISSLKINIIINVDRGNKCEKQMKALEEELKIEAFNRARDKAIINFHLSNGMY